MVHAEEVITVRSLAAALALRQIEHLRLLRAFMRPAGNTVTAAARELGLPPHRSYRLVKRLEALGLLRVLHRQTRVGRAVVVYICPARRFFIPKRLMGLEEFIWAGFDPFWQTLRASLVAALEDGPHPVEGVLVGDLPGDFLFTYADGERQV